MYVHQSIDMSSSLFLLSIISSGVVAEALELIICLHILTYRAEKFLSDRRIKQEKHEERRKQNVPTATLPLPKIVYKQIHLVASLNLL